MPLLTDGPLAGLYFPDTPDATLVNLMASLVVARGGETPHAPLAAAPPERLAEPGHLVLIVVDGLGAAQLGHYLASHPDSPFLGSHPHGILSTVFPATTASAVTTLLTAASPAEHGILGWNLNLPDLGLVSTVLLSCTRTGTPVAPEGFDLDAYLALPSYLDSVPETRAQLSYRAIPHSRFSRAGTRWDRVRAFADLAGLQREVERFCRETTRGLAYVYWPVHDALCHEFGIHHPRTQTHLAEIDAALAALRDALDGRGVTLLVTADHGIHDTPPDQCIDLAAVPGLYDCLATLPCGDAGHAHCFVRPRREARFLDLVAEHLGEMCHCVPGETLLELGAFGAGRPHPRLAGRVGDHVLIARDRQALAAPVAGEAPTFMVGNHGGMSRAEMRVPLFEVTC
ncbi:MAG: alkaline phosphatase family protein [Gammaproteobacteria bacterium]|nr:alkaline phosphatase family protein [Gammaproteobacteria bacterium]